MTDHADAPQPAGTTTTDGTSTPHGEMRVDDAVWLDVLENADDGAGRIWRVVMIRPGRSRNGWEYPPDVLTEAAHLYEGARAFDGHRTPDEKRRSSITGLVGWFTNVTARPDGALEADFTLAESAAQHRSLFLDAWRNQRPHMFGFSHDVRAAVNRTTGRVSRILGVNSVDVVADPSAGGQIETLVAGGEPEEREHPMAGDQTIDQAAADDVPATDERAVQPTATPEPPQPAPAPTAEQAVTETVEQPVSAAVGRMIFRSETTAAGLPSSVVDSLAESMQFGAVSAEHIERRVAEAASMWSTMAGAFPAPLPGQGNADGVTVTEAEHDKLVTALFGLFTGRDETLNGEKVPAFRSLREAYHRISGRHEHNLPGSADIGHWMLAESIGAVPEQGVQRLTEAVNTAQWADAFGETLNRMLIREYSFAPLRSWEQLVSDNTPITDFKNQRRDRIGGYDTLAVVGEAAAYPLLTSPTDEEASFQVKKYGGIEEVTFEAFANDDLNAIRRVPRAMARAAALTIYNAIWNTLIAGNAVTTYDAVALFAVGHGNTTGPLTLTEAALATLRQKMVQQQQLGETSGFIGAIPRYLGVPSDLWLAGSKLVRSQAVPGGTNDERNVFADGSLELLEVPTWTAAGDFYLFADPQSHPMIEMGWYNGRRDPEILVQDAPNVGAVFTNDVVKYKIRHIWEAVVLDHRGFQRATAI